MNTASIISENKLSQFVKDIVLVENNSGDGDARLPFFADGYPGIIFQKAPNGVYLLPENKKLSNFFLYGQTVHPIELTVKGSYQLIIFQLYPCAPKLIFGVNPKDFNDGFFDLSTLPEADAEQLIERLKATADPNTQAKMIAGFLSDRIKNLMGTGDKRIAFAVHYIIHHRGNTSIKDLRKQLPITARTLERQFLAYVGVTPKQFAKIIQFQSSLNQLTEEDYSALMDVVFDNGFSDQSHFIRTFKKYTGKTPSEFQSTMKRN